MAERLWRPTRYMTSLRTHEVVLQLQAEDVGQEEDDLVLRVLGGRRSDVSLDTAVLDGLA